MKVLSLKKQLWDSESNFPRIVELCQQNYTLENFHPKHLLETFLTNVSMLTFLTILTLGFACNHIFRYEKIH